MASNSAPQKSLLLRAWRERWSDTQWSIHAKRMLCSGQCDSSQLSELLMTQAFAQSSPNTLILNYIRHAISTQMISVNSVINFIVKYEDVGKIFCTRALLDLIENFSKRASTIGNYEDSLQVAKSFLSLLHWIIDLANKCMLKVQEDKIASEYCGLLEKISSIIAVLKSNKNTVGLLYVARLDDADIYQEMKLQHNKLLTNLSKMPSKHFTTESRAKLEDASNIVLDLAAVDVPPKMIVDMSHQSLNATINVLLNIEAILNPTNEIQPFVEQMLIVESSQGIERPRLYCELLRTCLIGMIDSAGGPEELKWAAFTFLKIPQVLVKLVTQGNDRERSQGQLVAGFDMLLNYVPLLDLTDTKCGADCMHFLLSEVGKSKLLSDAQCQRLTKRRQDENRKPPKQADQQNSQPSASLILRAEPTVTSILKTLDADYSKNQEALLGVLCHMMSGKSFELILAAAAATGKLQSFAIKLIKFNEFSKHTTGEAGKGAHTRSLLFDISFLMLCHITQLYGTEIVCWHPDSQNSFFLQWAQRCLPEGGKYKSPDLFGPADADKVESLLKQFNPGGELKFNLTRWADLCQHTPHAVKEVLYAWEHGVLNEQEVMLILDNVKGRMCCLPVVVSAWLCSYMNTIAADDRPKPLAMLQHLCVVSTASSTEQYYNERSQLMKNILTKITHDILPIDLRQSPPYEIPPDMPALQMLTETFRTVFKKGCTDIICTKKMEYLLNLTGPQWFCEYLIMEVLHYDRPEDLNRALGIAYALFTLDLENLVLCLVLHTLPNLLQVSGSRVNLLTDPRGKSLAKLTVISLLVLQNSKQFHKEQSFSATIKRGRKRTLSEVSLEDSEMQDDERPSKLRKLPADDPFSLVTAADNFDFGEIAPSVSEDVPEKSPSSPSYDTKDPLNKALCNLFRLLSAILSQPVISQRSGLVVSLVEEVLKAGSKSAKNILQFMPLTMVSQLMKYMPSTYSTDILITLCDLSSSQGRRVAAKVISNNAKSVSMQRAQTVA